MPKGNQLIKNNKRNRKENMKLKKNKGITLISLIITIILLLILVGTSLGIILQGNFFYKAKRTAKMADEKISSEGNTIEKGQNDWEQMEVDICSHIWGKEQITLEPTCTTPGKKVRECENCGKTIEVEIPALGHNYGDWVITKNVTCLQNGTKTKTCTVCGATQVETIKATGSHTYGAWVTTTSATCTTNGTRKRTCTACGTTENQGITKLGHNYVKRTCTRCGDVEALVVGANIDYHEYLSESGGTVSSSYTSTKTTRGSTRSNDSNAVFSVVKNSGIQWIVLGEENGQIKITTKNTVQSTSGGYKVDNFTRLYFESQKGYTNLISELNKVGAVYGKGKYADTTKFSSSGGRSFKMEDLGYGSLTRTAIYKYARHSDGKIYRYAANATVNGTSTIGGDDDVFYYMVLDASSSTSEGNYTWRSLPTTTYSSVTMYQYTYPGNQTLPLTVSKADTYYYLASRVQNYEDFGKACVGYNHYYVDTDGTVGGDRYWYVYGSFYGGSTSTYSVRPVVYLKSTAKLSNYSSTNGYTLSY